MALPRASPQPAPRTSQQLRAGQADDQDRGVAHPVGEVLDQVEERRLAAVHVVEEDDQRAPGWRSRSRRRRTAQRDFLDGRLPPRSHRAARPVGWKARRPLPRRGVAGRPAWPCSGRRVVRGQHVGGAAQQLDQRPEGDPLAVGQAASPQDPGTVADSATPVPGPGGLLPTPAAPRTVTSRETGCPRGLEGLEQGAELRGAVDQRGGPRWRAPPGRAADDVVDRPGGHVLTFAASSASWPSGSATTAARTSG